MPIIGIRRRQFPTQTSQVLETCEVFKALGFFGGFFFVLEMKDQCFIWGFSFILMKDQDVHYHRVYLTAVVAQTSQVLETCEVFKALGIVRVQYPILHRYRSEAQP